MYDICVSWYRIYTIILQVIILLHLIVINQKCITTQLSQNMSTKVYSLILLCIMIILNCIIKMYLKIRLLPLIYHIILPFITFLVQGNNK